MVEQRLPGFEHVPENGFHGVGQIRHHLPYRATDVGVDRLAIHIRQTMVDPPEAQIAVDERETHRRPFVDQIQFAKIVGVPGGHHVHFAVKPPALHLAHGAGGKIQERAPRGQIRQWTRVRIHHAQHADGLAVRCLERRAGEKAHPG